MRESGYQGTTALDRRPVIDDRLFYIRDLFFDLHRSRRRTMEGGPLPITLGDILTYAQVYSLTRAESQWIWEYVKVIDLAWLNASNEKQKKQNQKATEVGKMPAK